MKLLHNKADVMAWLEKARDDLRFAESVLNDTFYSHVCFICQQVAEKAIKGLIYSLQEDFSTSEIKELRTHRLNKLLKLAQRRNLSMPSEIAESFRVLEQYYLPTRYPDVPDPIGKYTKEIALDAFDRAKKIFEFVENYLK